jgi:hypothetical protein
MIVEIIMTNISDGGVVFQKFRVVRVNSAVVELETCTEGHQAPALHIKYRDVGEDIRTEKL